MIVVMRTGAAQEEIDAVKKAIADEGLETYVMVGEERIVMGVVGTGRRACPARRVDARRRAGRSASASPTSSPVERAPSGPIERARRATSRSAPERRSRSSPDPAPSSRASRSSRRRAGSSARARRSCAAARSSRAPRRTRSRASASRRSSCSPRRARRPGCPVVSEVTDPGDVAALRAVRRHAPGRRPEHGRTSCCCKAVGQSRKPVLLKRGLSSTIEEWLMAAEYILSSGNPNVILCERGIRTFETATRNTLDLSAVPVVRERTHLPVMVDPSHGTGHRSLVRPLSVAGAAVGRRRHHHRGPSRPAQGEVRLRAVALVPRVRRPHGRPAAPGVPAPADRAGRQGADRGAGRARAGCASASTTWTRGSRRCSRSVPSSRSPSSRRAAATTTATTSSASASSSSGRRRIGRRRPHARGARGGLRVDPAGVALGAAAPAAAEAASAVAGPVAANGANP